MTKITMMNEDANTDLDMQNISMQEVSGIGIHYEQPQADADDLMFLINQTNDQNKDAVKQAEDEYQNELRHQREAELLEAQRKEEEENMRRYEKEQEIIQERERLEAEAEAERLRLEEEKRQKSLLNKFKNKAGNIAEDAKNLAEGVNAMDISMPDANVSFWQTISLAKKIAISAGIFIAYNACSLLLAYIIIGGLV